MKAIVTSREIATFLKRLVARRGTVQLHASRIRPIIGNLVDLTALRLVLFQPVELAATPPQGATVKISGVMSGTPFVFLCDFLGVDEEGHMTLTTPFRVEVTERRTQARVASKAGMMLRVAVGGRHFEADIVDVSENGIAFSTTDLSLPLVEGTRLKARVDLVDNRFVPVELVVRYLDANRAGAVFLSIPQVARRELRKLAVPETHVVGRLALP